MPVCTAAPRFLAKGENKTVGAYVESMEYVMLLGASQSHALPVGLSVCRSVDVLVCGVV